MSEAGAVLFLGGNSSMSELVLERFPSLRHRSFQACNSPDCIFCTQSCFSPFQTLVQLCCASAMDLLKRQVYGL